jgi:hypothetical protein
VTDDDVRDAIEGGWREIDQIDAALARGEIDETGWHRAVLAIVEPAYLAAASPRRDLHRARRPGQAALSAVGRPHLDRQCPGLAAAATLRLRAYRAGLRPRGPTTRPHRHEAVRRTVHWLDGQARQGRK